MNLGHFCDPDARCYPEETKALDLQGRWTVAKVKHPIHDVCSGKTVIDFGLETELIVKCDCQCHSS